MATAIIYAPKKWEELPKDTRKKIIQEIDKVLKSWQKQNETADPGESTILSPSEEHFLKQKGERKIPPKDPAGNYRTLQFILENTFGIQYLVPIRNLEDMGDAEARSMQENYPITMRPRSGTGSSISETGSSISEMSTESNREGQKLNSFIGQKYEPRIDYIPSNLSDLLRIQNAQIWRQFDDTGQKMLTIYTNQSFANFYKLNPTYNNFWLAAQMFNQAATINHLHGGKQIPSSIMYEENDITIPRGWGNPDQLEGSINTINYSRPPLEYIQTLKDRPYSPPKSRPYSPPKFTTTTIHNIPDLPNETQTGAYPTILDSTSITAPPPLFPPRIDPTSIFYDPNKPSNFSQVPWKPNPFQPDPPRSFTPEENARLKEIHDFQLKQITEQNEIIKELKDHSDNLDITLAHAENQAITQNEKIENLVQKYNDLLKQGQDYTQKEDQAHITIQNKMQETYDQQLKALQENAVNQLDKAKKDFKEQMQNQADDLKNQFGNNFQNRLDAMNNDSMQQQQLLHDEITALRTHLDTLPTNPPTTGQNYGYTFPPRTTGITTGMTPPTTGPGLIGLPPTCQVTTDLINTITTSGAAPPGPRVTFGPTQTSTPPDLGLWGNLSGPIDYTTGTFGSQDMRYYPTSGISTLPPTTPKTTSSYKGPTSSSPNINSKIISDQILSTTNTSYYSTVKTNNDIQATLANLTPSSGIGTAQDLTIGNMQPFRPQEEALNKINNFLDIRAFQHGINGFNTIDNPALESNLHGWMASSLTEIIKDADYITSLGDGSTKMINLYALADSIGNKTLNQIQQKPHGKKYSNADNFQYHAQKVIELNNRKLAQAQHIRTYEAYGTILGEMQDARRFQEFWRSFPTSQTATADKESRKDIVKLTFDLTIPGGSTAQYQTSIRKKQWIALGEVLKKTLESEVKKAAEHDEQLCSTRKTIQEKLYSNFKIEYNKKRVQAGLTAGIRFANVNTAKFFQILPPSENVHKEVLMFPDLTTITTELEQGNIPSEKTSIIREVFGNRYEKTIPAYKWAFGDLLSYSTTKYAFQEIKELKLSPTDKDTVILSLAHEDEEIEDPEDNTSTILKYKSKELKGWIHCLLKKVLNRIASILSNQLKEVIINEIMKVEKASTTFDRQRMQTKQREIMQKVTALYGEDLNKACPQHQYSAGIKGWTQHTTLHCPQEPCFLHKWEFFTLTDPTITERKAIEDLTFADFTPVDQTKMHSNSACRAQKANKRNQETHSENYLRWGRDNTLITSRDGGPAKRGRPTIRKGRGRSASKSPGGRFKRSYSTRRASANRGGRTLSRNKSRSRSRSTWRGTSKKRFSKRRTSTSRETNPSRENRSCHKCGKIGHIAKYCHSQRGRTTTLSNSQTRTGRGRSKSRNPDKSFKSSYSTRRASANRAGRTLSRNKSRSRSRSTIGNRNLPTYGQKRTFKRNHSGSRNRKTTGIGNCSRCGRTNHYATECTARFHINREYLGLTSNTTRTEKRRGRSRSKTPSRGNYKRSFTTDRSNINARNRTLSRGRSRSRSRSIGRNAPRSNSHVRIKRKERPQGPTGNKYNNTPYFRTTQTCHNCGKQGHIKAQCTAPLKSFTQNCYNCHQPGHIAKFCPHATSTTNTTYTPRRSSSASNNWRSNSTTTKSNVLTWNFP